MFVASVLESLCLLILTVCIDKTITYIDKCSTLKRFPNECIEGQTKMRMHFIPSNNNTNNETDSTYSN